MAVVVPVGELVYICRPRVLQHRVGLTWGHGRPCSFTPCVHEASAKQLGWTELQRCSGCLVLYTCVRWPRHAVLAHTEVCPGHEPLYGSSRRNACKVASRSVQLPTSCSPGEIGMQPRIPGCHLMLVGVKWVRQLKEGSAKHHKLTADQGRALQLCPAGSVHAVGGCAG